MSCCTIRRVRGGITGECVTRRVRGGITGECVTRRVRGGITGESVTRRVRGGITGECGITGGMCCVVLLRGELTGMCYVVCDVGLLEEPAEGDSDVMNLLSSLQGIVLSLPFFHLSTTYPHTV